MSKSSGGRTRKILKRAGMKLSTPFADMRPLAMANRLLDERARGMVPVWPTTDRYAHRLAEGFEMLKETRGEEVAEAIAEAPEDTGIDWRAHFTVVH